MTNITSGAKLFGFSDLSITPPNPLKSNPAGNPPTQSAKLMGDNTATYELRTNAQTPDGLAFTFMQEENVQRQISFTGFYKIVGKVEINTVVVAGKWVYIFPEGAPSLCIGAQYTDTSGNFSFMFLKAGRYVVYAMDPNFNYNGKMYENIAAVPM